MEAFAERVRSRDFEGGMRLFCDDLVAFGTVSERAEGLEFLRREQWAKVWPQTAGFRFDLSDAHETPASDGSQTVVTALWTSQGIAEDGSAYPRRGRATVVLRAQASGPTGWLATHTHFSISPTGRTPSEEGPRKAD